MIKVFLLLAASGLLAACAGKPRDRQPDSPPETSIDLAAGTGDSAQESGHDLAYPKWETVAPGEQISYNQRASLVQRGHLVYQKYCIGCHGEYGDGDGPATPRLKTRPRDFTSGIYKFRSTDSGSLPMEEDLYRTLTRGLARVSMPAFPFMPAGEKLAVIEYIKNFYPQWEQDKDDRRIVPIPLAPSDLFSQQRRWRGKEVYRQIGCGKCHGTDGRGTGATQTEYIDAWGFPQKPFDFTRGSLKGGNGPLDIYRTFHTGLRSIMPSFGGETLAAAAAEALDTPVDGVDAEAERVEWLRGEFPATADAIFSEMNETQRLKLAERNSWDLVAYILSLRNPTTTAAAVLGSAWDRGQEDVSR